MSAKRTIAFFIFLLTLAAPDAQAEGLENPALVTQRISGELLSYLQARRNSPVVPVHALAPAAVTTPAPFVVPQVLPRTPQPVIHPERRRMPEKRQMIVKPQGLGTLHGFDVGLDISKYAYHEEVGDGVPFMNTKGKKAGVEAGYSFPLDNNWFLRGEGRFAYGPVQYSGSGSSKNNEEYLWELRALAGRDFSFDGFTLSPYSGYGGRHLVNDLRGLTSTGAGGYRRRSYYEYVPVGVTQRFNLGAEARIAANLEYDHFIKGEQQSQLGDVSPANSLLINTQDRGYAGARGSLLYETPLWAVGPWFNYWNIGDSKVSCSGSLCGLEPANKTTEFGLKLVRKFSTP